MAPKPASAAFKTTEAAAEQKQRGFTVLKIKNHSKLWDDFMTGVFFFMPHVFDGFSEENLIMEDVMKTWKDHKLNFETTVNTN